MSKLSNKPIYLTDDFRDCIRFWVQAKGRGEYKRIAEALSMHTTLISQVMMGKKCLTEEQAARGTIYMGLGSAETDYFVKLVQIERAGTTELKSLYLRQLADVRESFLEIRNRVAKAKKMSHEDQAIFYSSWQYSAVRILTSLKDFQTEATLAKKLNLTLSRVQEIVRFLNSRGLCVDKDGRFERTEVNTHVEKESPLSVRHHQNWRAKSIELHERLGTEDIAFTAPISISKKNFQAVRSILLDTIKSISQCVEESESEEICYLGIDWMRL